MWVVLLKQFKTYHIGYYRPGIQFNSTFPHSCLSVVLKFVSWNSSVFAGLLPVTTYFTLTVFINTNDTAIWRLMLCGAEPHLFNRESYLHKDFHIKKPVGLCVPYYTSMSMFSMSLFRPMDHYNDIGHVNTNVTLQLNVWYLGKYI